MRNKIKITAMMLMALILLLAPACLKRGTGGIQPLELHKGTDAFSMEFLQSAPPPTVFAPEPPAKLEPFQVGLKIDNKGAYDITEGFLSVALEEDYMTILDWNFEKQKKYAKIGATGEKISFSLEGKTQLNPFGETDIITFTAGAKKVDDQSEKHKSTILVTACYEYATELSQQVCIDTDIYNLKPIEKVCNPKDISISGGQGAPIAITKIEQRMLPSGANFVRPQFIIYMENKGNGNVIANDRTSKACSAEGLKPEDWNVIELVDVEFSGFSLKKGDIVCSPMLKETGKVRIKLQSGADFIKCTLDKDLLSTEQPTYTTALNIQLKYGYTYTISKDVIVEKILTY